MKNILVITYWNFEDALIQTYTLPYVRIMEKYLPADSKIYLVTLEKDHENLRGEKYRKITSAMSTRIVWLPFAYHRFGVQAMLGWVRILTKLFLLILSKKISFIHSWATPAGAAGYVLSVLTGRKLVLDSYEPHAESMVENGTWKKNSLSFKVLFLFERLQSKRASYVISATEGMRQYARIKYQVEFKNFCVKPACVDLNLFSRKNLKKPALLKSLGLNDKIVCVYAGKFGGIYFIDEVFSLLKYAHQRWGEKFRALLLTGHSQIEINEFCDRASLDRGVVIRQFVPHSDIPDYMGLGDFALTPCKPVPSKRYCTPIKDGEYWALGLPVIIPEDISDDADIIRSNNVGAVIRTYSPEYFPGALTIMEEILQESSETRYARIRALAEKYRNFSLAHDAYRNVYGDDFK